MVTFVDVERIEYESASAKIDSFGKTFTTTSPPNKKPTPRGLMPQASMSVQAPPGMERWLVVIDTPRPRSVAFVSYHRDQIT